MTFYQCSGSGSVGSFCFWTSRIHIRIRLSQVRIRIQLRLRIIPLSCENRLLYDFLPVFRIRRIRMFLGILDPHPDPLVRCTDPRIRNRIRIVRIRNRIWIVPVPKCHGSSTLVFGMIFSGSDFSDGFGSFMYFF